MKKFLTLSILLALCVNVAWAQNSAYKTDENIAYRAASDPSFAESMCQLNIYYPTNNKGFATIIWFHGGGLTGGRREIPRELQGKGYAVVGVDYRLSPQVAVEGCIDDAAAACAWVVRNIASYGGDVHKIFVAGHSAGGYLSSMVGLDKRWMGRYGLDPDDCFAALIPYSGQAITHYTRRQEMGIRDVEPLVDSLAPLRFVRPDCPPILILSGDRELEMLGRYEENAYFWRMMRVVGHKDVQLLEFDGFDHGNMPQAGHFAALRYIAEKLKKSER